MNGFKKLVYWMPAMVLILSCSQYNMKIPDNELDVAKLQFAKDFTDDFFLLSRRGDTLDFDGLVTDQLKIGMNGTNQFDVYNYFKAQFGDFVISEFVEAWHVKRIKDNYAYRFQGTFTESDSKLELRVVLDNSDKVAAYYVGLWKDVFP